MLILNLVARDVTIKSEIIDRVKNTFKTVFIKKIEQEVNEVVFALNSDNSEDDIRKFTERNNKYMLQCMSKGGGTLDEELISQMSTLKVT